MLLEVTSIKGLHPTKSKTPSLRPIFFSYVQKKKFENFALAYLIFRI